MRRRRILLALIPANAALFVLADSGWTRTAAVFGALGCLFAYLSARSTDRKEN